MDPPANIDFTNTHIYIYMNIPNHIDTSLEPYKTWIQVSGHAPVKLDTRNKAMNKLNRL